MLACSAGLLETNIAKICLLKLQEITFIFILCNDPGTNLFPNRHCFVFFGMNVIVQDLKLHQLKP